ncbi:MAG: mechanosensitive ion channel domain-containing protein [Pseudomonadota bacterium]
MHRILLGLIVAICLTLAASLASAQLPGLTSSSTEETPEIVPEDLTPETVLEMVSRLSDEDVRTLLIERLDAVAQANVESEAAGQSFGAFLESSALGVGESIATSTRRVPDMADGVYRGFSNFGAARGWGGAGQYIGLLLATIACGALGALAVDGVARKWRANIKHTTAPVSLRQTLRVLSQRLILDVGGLVAFFIVTRLFEAYVLPEGDQQLVRIFVSNMIMLPWFALTLTRFLMAPHRPELRLVYTDDWTARYVHWSMFGLAILLGFTIWLLSFLHLNGVPFGELRLGFWLNLAIFIWLIYAVFRTRKGLVSMMAGGDREVTRAEAWVARAYPWFAMAMIVITWLIVEVLAYQQMWHLLDGRQFVTLVLILFAPAFDTLIRGLVKHLSPPMTGEGLIAEQAYHATKRSYIRMGRVVVFGMVIWIIASLWQIDFSNLASAGVGARAAAKILEVLFLIAVGYLIWEAVTLWINRKLAAEQTAAGFDLNEEEPGGGEGGGAGGSRMSSVLPLIRWGAQAAIITITILIALGDIGIDITPLLAGAGIVGLAIGFGAQKLVTDVVSGMFFLIDDAFRVGEYIDVGGTLGTVEKISLRSLRLRHHRGTVHTIPYGEIPKVANFSRDWVIMKLRFTVPFDTDLNKVKKIFKQIGREMMEVPEYAEDFIQPFKSQGVLEVDDVGIVMRGKFMAKPGKQFVLRKEIYSRVQKSFDDNGIQFARKEVRVKIDGANAEEMSESELQAAGSAAHEAAQKPLEPKPAT